MSNHENKQFRFKENDSESTNGSDQGPSDHNRNRKKERNGKAKEPHYQHPSDGTSRNGFNNEGPMTDMIRSVDLARRYMAVVDDMYAQLSQDIQAAVRNREKVVELELEVRLKDERIEKHQDTIDRILERSGKKDEKLEKKRQEIEKAEKELEKKRAEVDKLKAREEMKAKEAELERSHAHDAQLKKRSAALDSDFKERKDKLEKELKQREEDGKKKLTDLEAENKRLSNQVKELNGKTNSYKETLATQKETIEDIETLKKNYKKEAAEAQNELHKMKAEFGLTSNTPEFFQKGFVEIAGQIHGISTNFCRSLDPKDWASLHDKLKDLDPCFASIPISDSEDSKLLRTAHMERIISFSLSTLVFKPFSSDNTFQTERQHAVNLLEEVALGLGRSGDNRRAAAVFKSLAIRGLGSPNSQETASSLYSKRTDAFLQSIKPVWSLLIPQAQHESLEENLRTLAESAMSLWNTVQNDEFLEINASLDLDLALREKWRSPLFDEDCVSNGLAVTLSTRPRIFTLFPHITAKAFATGPEPTVKIPGSFENPKAEAQMREFCIHPGIGMCESSALVLRGKEEQEDLEEELKDEKLIKELEATKKALSERNKLRSQRHGSITSLPSPGAE
ncbi:hypothetical protein BKA64DRAFT_634087 [Cadophora sp. MPI-SDFR-AT-0126]|nr:hypothetical protein BKA64DRAFT_634087 [Leotiomycetes sp. MPI-SDFR-AT-0126]